MIGLVMGLGGADLEWEGYLEYMIDTCLCVKSSCLTYICRVAPGKFILVQMSSSDTCLTDPIRHWLKTKTPVHTAFHDLTTCIHGNMNCLDPTMLFCNSLLLSSQQNSICTRETHVI